MENLKKIKELLKEGYPRLYSRISRSIENGWGQDEDIEDYLESAAKTYKEHDQGSLSFTATALKHSGYNYPWGVLECVDCCKNK